MFKKKISKKDIAELFKVTILALAVGLAAGVIGAVITENYLYRYNDQLDQSSLPLRLAEEKPRPLPGTYEEAVEIVREKVSPALVQIYVAPKSGASIAGQILDPDEALAAGVVVTADGWVATAGLVGDYQLSAIVATIGHEVVEIEQVAEDSATDLVLLKLAANNLPVVSFGVSEEVAEGDLAFVVPARDALIATSVAAVKDQNGTVHASEALLRHFELADDFAMTALGAPVTNSAGELIGFATNDLLSSAGPNLVRPLHHLLPAIESILRNGEVVRSFMGVYAVDLVSAIGLSEEVTRGYEHGALIIRDPSSGYVSGVVPGSPADEAGLLAEDIILEIDGITVNADAPLAEILLDYEPGESMVLVLDRDGELINIDLILEEL